jgi:serine/threonine-protein kinase RsbT
MQTSSAVARDAGAHIAIASPSDIVDARRWVRSVATAASFAPADITVVVAALSELARNMIVHARRGEIVVQLVEDGDRRGIRIEACDAGPRPADLEGSTNGRTRSDPGPFDLGLPAVRRVMDEFTIHSDPAHGTRVVVTKWRT